MRASAGLALTGLITGSLALVKAQELRNAVDPLAADFAAQQGQVRALSATTDVLLIGAVLTFGVTVAATTLPPLIGRKRKGAGP